MAQVATQGTLYSSQTPAKASVVPDELHPIMTSAPPTSIAFLAALLVSTLSFRLSYVSSTTLYPAIPPAALISSTNISRVFFSGVPQAAASPVRGPIYAIRNSLSFPAVSSFFSPHPANANTKHRLNRAAMVFRILLIPFPPVLHLCFLL